MAECQNFFDDPSPSSCRSSSSTDQLLPSTRNECADHGFELRLGPCVDANKPKQHEMVRPIPLYPSLDKQRSGNFTHAIENSSLFRGHSDVATADKALFSKDSAFTTLPRISREQVWHTLQKTNAVLGQEDVRTSNTFCEDVAASVWGRRSTSMQIMMPSSETSEVDVCPIRRSCSNGVPVSCQSSLSEEALVDESPDPTYLLSYNQQHEALELQQRRAMQAHRRLEARKRRRLLIEVKQQKKGRQNSGPNNRQCVSQMDRVSLACTQSMDRNWALRRKTHHEVLCAKAGDDKGSKDGYNTKNVRTEDMSPLQRGKLNTPFDGNDDNGLGNIEKMMMHKECESDSSGSKHIKGDLTNLHNVMASCDLSLHDSNQAGKDADVVEGVKSTPSSCSETESTETKGCNPCKEMDTSEREWSSQKSSMDSHLDLIGLPLSKPALYPRGLLHATSGFPTMHANLTQCPPAASGENDGLHMKHSASLACRPADAIGDMVSNSSPIKKSVGVFSEGKWKSSDEKSAFFPIRRTSSNIIEAATNPQSSAKLLETCVSGAASQLKFARNGLDDAADASYKNRTDALRENLSCTSRLYLHNMAVKKESDSYTEEEKPIVVLKDPGTTRDTSLDIFGLGMCKAEVKQEEDMTSFKGHLVSKHSEPDAVNMHSGVINRQRSASFLDLPWVTTTGTGPNGKTINGVMYISSRRSVWLVCRCHGKHMSPAEFVEHSGSTDLSNPLRNIVVNPSPLFNRVATTPV